MLHKGRERVTDCLVFLSFLVLTALLGGCRTQRAKTPVPSLARSMKGYELHSWYVDTDWRFALVVGTNRIKTFEEISSPAVRLEGLEALKDELKRLPSGEQVLWSAGLMPGATLPPDDIVEAVRAFCRQRGIQLSIGGAGATYRYVVWRRQPPLRARPPVAGG